MSESIPQRDWSVPEGAGGISVSVAGLFDPYTQ